MIIKDCPQISSRKSNIIVPKGEFVIFTDKKTWCLGINPSIEVSCQYRDVAFISSCAFPFLCAISDPRIRFEVFANKLNNFNRLVNLVIGDEADVLVDVRSNKLALKAIIRYKGGLPEMVGHYFGVELLVSPFWSMHFKCSWTCKTWYI